MSVDLTRFDFHVFRFLNSPDVERMSCTEVGQYVLLLCKAWANGDDCLLPADMCYLGRVCRLAQGQHVSKRVLSKFQLIEKSEGSEPELTVMSDRSDGYVKVNTKNLFVRNEALFNEWQKACKRVEVGLKYALRRWEEEPSPMGTQMGTHDGSQGRPNGQAVPNQTIQTIQTKRAVVGDVLDEVQNQKFDESELGAIKHGEPGYFKRGQYPGTKPKQVFSYLAKAWSRVKGEAAYCRYPSKYPEEFEQLCDQKSGDLVVPAFELWVQKHGSKMSTQWPVLEFLKVAEDFMSKVIPLNKTRPDVTEADLKQITENAVKMHMEQWKRAPVEEENKEGLTDLFGPEQPEKN